MPNWMGFRSLFAQWIVPAASPSIVFLNSRKIYKICPYISCIRGKESFGLSVFCILSAPCIQFSPLNLYLHSAISSRSQVLNNLGMLLRTSLYNRNCLVSNNIFCMCFPWNFWPTWKKNQGKIVLLIIPDSKYNRKLLKPFLGIRWY